MTICFTDVNADLGGEEVLDGVKMGVCACLQFKLVEVNAGFELIWLRDTLFCVRAHFKVGLMIDRGSGNC